MLTGFSLEYCVRADSSQDDQAAGSLIGDSV